MLLGCCYLFRLQLLPDEPYYHVDSFHMHAQIDGNYMLVLSVIIMLSRFICMSRWKLYVVAERYYHVDSYHMHAQIDQDTWMLTRFTCMPSQMEGYILLLSIIIMLIRFICMPRQMKIYAATNDYLLSTWCPCMLFYLLGW